MCLHLLAFVLVIFSLIVNWIEIRLKVERTVYSVRFTQWTIVIRRWSITISPIKFSLPVVFSVLQFIRVEFLLCWLHQVVSIFMCDLLHWQILLSSKCPISVAIVVVMLTIITHHIRMRMAIKATPGPSCRVQSPWAHKIHLRPHQQQPQQQLYRIKLRPKLCSAQLML